MVTPGRLILVASVLSNRLLIESTPKFGSSEFSPGGIFSIKIAAGACESTIFVVVLVISPVTLFRWMPWFAPGLFSDFSDKKFSAVFVLLRSSTAPV